MNFHDLSYQALDNAVKRMSKCLRSPEVLLQRDRDYRKKNKKKKEILTCPPLLSPGTYSQQMSRNFSVFHYGAIGPQPSGGEGAYRQSGDCGTGFIGNRTGHSFAQVYLPQAALFLASRSHPPEPLCCLKNKKRFPGPLPRMACAISLTPMGSPSGPPTEKPLQLVDRLV